jgi:aquacobalamin reductase/NAD(P)H-flavin reductase
MNEKDKRPFSIASSPKESDIIELHIGASNANSYAMETVNYISSNSEIFIELPYGDAWFREDNRRPVMLIVGGTGFAYARSIMLTALEQERARNITLYWGMRESNHFYDLDSLYLLRDSYSNLEVILTAEKSSLSWKNHTGTVLTVVTQNYTTLAEYDIYIAGRQAMVRDIRDLLVYNYSAIKDQIFGDALSFI